MVNKANVVWRDRTSDGVPSSEPHEPEKSEIRAWGTDLELKVETVAVPGGKTYPTKTAMDAATAPDQYTGAICADPDPAKAGWYYKSAAANSAGWTIITSAIPGQHVLRGTNAGAGSANAIVATTPLPVPGDDFAIVISLNITATNTASPVTVAFNGASPKTIKTISGGDVPIGALTAGMVVDGYVTNSGANFRLRTDISSAAVQAAVAADAATVAADKGLTATYRSETLTARNEAVTAKDQALGANRWFASIAAGLAGSTDGQLFSVTSPNPLNALDVYVRTNSTTATWQFSTPSATLGRLVQISNQDRAAGLPWSLADWYLDVPSRILAHPWIDASDWTTCFQDVAGATAVTAAAQSVRLIKSKIGVAAHDLIIFDTNNPALSIVRGGVRGVDLNGVAGFNSRGDFTLRVPTFLSVAVEHRQTGKVLLGVQSTSSTQYLRIASPTNTQYRNRIETNFGTPSFNPADGGFEHSPINAPQVIHASFEIGTHNIGTNELGLTAETLTGWTGSESATAKLRVGMTLHNQSSNVQGVFFGAFMFDGIIDAATRSRIVDYLRRKCEPPILATDKNIAADGDSTGSNHRAFTGVGGGVNAAPGMLFRVMQSIAAANSGFRVIARRYHEAANGGLGGYGPPEIVQDGTSGVIRLWNGSVAGSIPNQSLGTQYNAKIGALPSNVDEIWINTGYNIDTIAPTVAAQDGYYASGIEPYKQRFPSAHLLLVRQARTTSNNNMDNLAAAVDRLATLYDASKIDIHAEFIAYSGGTQASLRDDGLHFSETGAVLAATRFYNDRVAALPIVAKKAGFMRRRVQSPAPNAKFFEWVSGLPVGYTKTGSGSHAEVAAADNDNPENPSALQIADTSGTSTYFSVAIPANGAVDFRGQLTWIAVRLNIPSGQSVTANSRIEVITNGTGPVSLTVPLSSKWFGGWQYFFVPVTPPADATTITVRLYGRATGAAALTVQYNEVCASLYGPRRAA